nr:unnamed protein product [Callosobruchus analis]
MQISIFFVFICATAFSRVAAYSEENVVRLIHSVPLEERRRFIKEQLFAGYLKTESLDYKLADDDAVQLYNIYMKNCPKVTPHSGMLRERICLPNGHCFDPDDSGVYP